MISLAPLSRDAFETVSHIALRKDQLKFAGTVVEAFAEPAERFDLHQILNGKSPIGIFKIDRFYARDYSFAQVGDVGLRALILDERVQGKGYGSLAMKALGTYLSSHYPSSKTVWLTVNLTNPIARRTYISAGFEDTGTQWPHGYAGPQNILRLRLNQA